MALEETIAEIKKEIVESHNLIIKTDNLVKNLSADIRQIQKRQERYERKYIFNSVVAYVIFVVVIFGGLYVAFDAKVGVVRQEKESLEKQLQQMQEDTRAMQEKISRRSQQEKITERFLLLKQQGRPYDALKEAEALDTSNLSPVMTRLVKKELAELKQSLANRSIESGSSYLQKGQLKRALREFDRALELSPPAKVLARVQHNRGLVLSKLRKNARAARAFRQAAEADPQSSSADNDLFMAGGSFEAAGDMPQAIESYQRLLDLYSSSAYASAARRRIQRLSRGKPTSGTATPAGGIHATPATPASAAPAPRRHPAATSDGGSQPPSPKPQPPKPQSPKPSPPADAGRPGN